MKNARFWLGIATLTAACVVVILEATPGYQLTRNGIVKGRVRLHGRPLAGGAVLFYPEDPTRCDFASARIDEKGRFVISPDWRRRGPGRTRFRISVVPSEDAATLPGQTAKDSEASRPVMAEASAVPVSMGSGSLTFPAPVAESSRSNLPHRFSNPFTSGLTIELGTEPARIDIDLKDD